MPTSTTALRQLRSPELQARRQALARMLGVAGAALAPGWSVAAAPGVRPNEVVIGQSITLQGGKNEYGVAVMDGIRASLDAANARGGVNGRQVVLRTLDDDNQVSRAQANARRLAQSGEVFLLFGSLEGGSSTAVMDVAVESGVPFFGPMAGSPGLRRPHQPLVFPVRAEHREEFRALLRYGHERGMRGVAFLHADSAVGRAHLENVGLLCREFGMQLTTPLPTDANPDDGRIAAMVAQLKNQTAQMMINHGSGAIYERVIRAARAADVRTVFMGVNSGSSQLANRLGALAEGMVFSQVVPSPSERKTLATRDYQASFRAAWPGKPYTYGSFEGWLTAQALLAALKQVGPNLSHQSFLSGLNDVALSISGLTLRYTPHDHIGLNFVDLSMFSRERRFIH